MSDKQFEDSNFPVNGEARLKGVEVKVSDLNREMGVLKEKMAHLATRDDIAQLRAENAELKAMIAQSEARMFKMLAMQTTIIVAALIGVLISPLLQ